jgi:hypothetical protein
MLQLLRQFFHASKNNRKLASASRRNLVKTKQVHLYNFAIGWQNPPEHGKIEPENNILQQKIALFPKFKHLNKSHLRVWHQENEINADRTVYKKNDKPWWQRWGAIITGHFTKANLVKTTSHLKSWSANSQIMPPLSTPHSREPQPSSKYVNSS